MKFLSSLYHAWQLLLAKFFDLVKLEFWPPGPPSPLGVRGQIWIAYSMLRYMKVKPYQFGLATISGFRDHLEVTRIRTNRNQLVNIYLIKDSQFYSDFADILAILPTHGLILLTKFDQNCGLFIICIFLGQCNFFESVSTPAINCALQLKMVLTCKGTQLSLPILCSMGIPVPISHTLPRYVMLRNGYALLVLRIYSSKKERKISIILKWYQI